MASNNYLGLTFDPRVIEGAVKGLNNMVLAQVVLDLCLEHFHYLESLKMH